MTYGPDIARRRFRTCLVIAVFAIAFAGSDPDAVLFAQSMGSSPTSIALRRDWWFKAPGGSYGLVEVSQVNHLGNPPERKSRTSILIGPWRWTFEATAPQVITAVTVPTLIALFTWGWIRTRRPHG